VHGWVYIYAAGVERRNVGRQLILFRLKNAAVSTTQNWRAVTIRIDDGRAGPGYSCLRRSLGGATASNGVRSSGYKLRRACATG